MVINIIAYVHSNKVTFNRESEREEKTLQIFWHGTV